MKRAFLVLFLIAIAGSGTAQQHKNQKKGFNANDVYQFNGLDSINAFSGNLNIAIPLGATYTVGANMSYRFVLYANANVWEGEEHCDETPPDTACKMICPRFTPGCDEPAKGPPTFMYPHRRANAGIGWTLSLGRLFQPEHPLFPENGKWIYESPDGADHAFEPGGAGTLVSVDGSNLRLTPEFNPSYPGNLDKALFWHLELPNGEIHTFIPPDGVHHDYWALQTIKNRFESPTVTISYGSGPNPLAGESRWTISDSVGRTHYIDFAPIPFDGEQRLMVKNVHLSVWDPQGDKATFGFEYVQDSFWRGASHNDPFHDNDNPPRTDYTIVSLLDRVILPDGLDFKFKYDDGGILGNGGVPEEMTLPTGGKIAWTWGNYDKPAASDFNSMEYFRTSYGVVERKLYGRPATLGGTFPLEGTWTYEPRPESVTEPGEEWPDCYHNPAYPVDQASCHEYRNIITDPLGNKTVHYFSVATLNSFPPWNASEYGLPFTKYEDDDTDAPNTRWLSTQVLNANGTPHRSTYLRYGIQNEPRPVESTRTVYHDDQDRYVQTDSSDWAGYGLFRTQTRSGTIPHTPTRTTTTNYTAPTLAWIIGLYDSVTVTEDGKSSRTEFCFDAGTGFLNQKRVRKDAEIAGSTDLVARYSPYENSDDGSVFLEEYFGGDIVSTADRTLIGGRRAASVGTGDPCDEPTGVPTYSIQHARVLPTATTDGTLVSTPVGVDTTIADVTIDRHSGLVSASRDTAGVETVFEYDWAGRLTAEKPTGRASTIYQFLSPGSDEISVTRTMTGSTDPLPWSKFKIDGLGRVVKETTAIPDSAEAVRNTVYDGLGRRVSVSEPNQPSALTEFTYDLLGRTKNVTSPDGSLIQYEYVGEREKTRKAKIWTGVGVTDTEVPVTELYDGFGRLVSVTEKSGPTSATSTNGAPITTEYKYDLADRLVEVVMNRTPGGPLQRRLFDYDGRGFLRWESQPESGISSYLYDARGHVATKFQAAAQSQFDLDYFYDEAERVIRLEARNPLFGTNPFEPKYRPMKEFEYSTENDDSQSVVDRSKGKLQYATRYNYVFTDGPAGAVNTYRIVDHYEYLDLAGRQTGRDTDILENDNAVRTFSTYVTYNELDLPVSQTYPVCFACGVPPGDWDRDQMVRSYDRGRLKSLSGFINNMTYWPNGLRHLLVHSNGVTDTQTVGVMPRPSSIAFAHGGACVQPSLDVGPFNQTSSQPEDPVNLFVTASGTGPLSYQWYEEEAPIENETTSSITVYPKVTTWYSVDVTNACGEVRKGVQVAVGACPAPRTGIVQAVRQPDNSLVLKSNPTSRESATYQWEANGVPLGTNKTLAIGVVSETTTYQFTVTDACGSATATTTVTVPLQMTTTGLVAAASVDRSKIVVTWPAVSGATLATRYTLSRRGSDGTFVEWSSLAATSYDDTTANATAVYAYQVTVSAGGMSNMSNIDLATRGTFTAAVPNTAIATTPFDEMLRAVNAVRAIANWPGVTWQSILAPTDPVVGSGKGVAARQLLAARARMNEALQAIGAPVVAYTDADTTDLAVKALHINEIQQRVQ